MMNDELVEKIVDAAYDTIGNIDDNIFDDRVKSFKSILERYRTDWLLHKNKKDHNEFARCLNYETIYK